MNESSTTDNNSHKHQRVSDHVNATSTKLKCNQLKRVTYGNTATCKTRTRNPNSIPSDLCYANLANSIPQSMWLLLIDLPEARRKKTNKQKTNAHIHAHATSTKTNHTARKCRPASAAPKGHMPLVIY